MPMRGTPTLRATREHPLPLVLYRDFLAVCSLVVIGLAASVGLALLSPTSTVLIASLPQLGG
jgi:hypothetical protein